MKLKPSRLLNSLLRIHPLTFVNKALHLVTTTRWFICLLLWIVWHQLPHLCLECMMHCVTKATPIQFINGNKLKSCRMGSTNYTQPMSHHITPLVINGPRGRHTGTQTHTHTDAWTETISRNQACTEPSLKIDNFYMYDYYMFDFAGLITCLYFNVAANWYSSKLKHYVVQNFI